MFTKEDFRITSADEVLDFLPIAVFLAFIGPFILIAYSVGFLLDRTGRLDR